ncbi:hypothetical protein KI688_012345 [Linnemannia hyalina]|uniref:UBA domain-containing protein n=1 Tax=Linnemannia hyalina TaxID=64524 RepID=A0A9P7XXK0_9FUNG|nr:hypothetical protein KI688_012345 [Linnemannia hyalina]
MDKSERLLNDLLKIPVNTICCDCGAASKNLSLPSLTMKKWGNGKVNSMYMPHPERHPPPISMEGSAMEQYIRSKYERKEFMEGGGNYQPSGRSAYGNTFSGGRGTGSRNDVVNSNSYTTQMSALRAMGFKDNAKNLQVLQSTDGDVPNAIEILCRIGQGPVSSPPIASSNNNNNNNNISRTYSRPSPSSNNNNNSNNNASRDPKEAILWNMGFNDSALNKEALRRAGGNPEVAAALLIDEKDKLAKAVREKGGSSSPLPARLDPPGAKKSQKSEDLLLDLSTDDDQQQQQQQQHMMMQQQMQMQNAFGNNNQQWNQQTAGLDQFGQNQNQLQSILDKNAQILALYSNETNNNNNNNMFGNNGMNNAFGVQQQQTGFNNDMNSWAMNNNNNNNNQQMNSAFGIQTSMATGANNMFGDTNSSMGMGMGTMGTMGMNNLQQQQLQHQQQQMNPFGVSQASQQPTSNALGNNMFNNNNNNNQFAGMGGNNGGGLGSPFNSVSATTNTNNNNMFGHNPMGGMGMNTNNNGMNGGFGAGGNSPFGMNNNNNNNNNNFNNNNPNPWGNNNNNNNNNLF